MPSRAIHKRPLFWLAAVLLLILGGGLYGVWRFFAPLPIPPKEPWLEQWVALAESHQRPGENAFPLYVEAAKLAEEIQQQTQPEFLPDNAASALLYGEWDDPRLDRAKKALRDLAPAIDIAVEASKRPSWRRWPGEDVFSKPLDQQPDLEEIAWDVRGDSKSVVNLHRILLPEMRRAMAEGQNDLLVESFAALYRLGRFGSAEPSAARIRWLPIETVALEELRRLLVEQPGTSIATLRALIDIIEAPRLPEISFEEVIEGQRLLSAADIRNDRIDLAQETKRDIWESLIKYPPWKSAPHAIWRQRLISYKELQAAQDRVFDAVKKWAGTPFGKPVSTIQPVLQSNRYGWSVLGQELWRDYRMHHAHQLTHRRATLALLHAAIHRADTGEWPEQLKDAAPAPLYIDVATAMPYFYERREDGLRFRLPGTLQDYQRLYGSRTMSQATLEQFADLLRPRPPLDNETWYLGPIGEIEPLDPTIPDHLR